MAQRQTLDLPVLKTTDIQPVDEVTAGIKYGPAGEELRQVDQSGFSTRKICVVILPAWPRAVSVTAALL